MNPAFGVGVAPDARAARKTHKVPVLNRLSIIQNLSEQRCRDINLSALEGYVWCCWFY